MTRLLKPRAALDRKDRGRLTFWTFWACVPLTCGGCDSGRKAAECNALVDPINQLSAMLTATRGVLSTPDVQPAQVADTLQPFSDKAKSTARALQAQPPTSSALRKVSRQAADAAMALGKQSAAMADYARQMADMDTTNRAVEDGKRRVDELESEIKQACEKEASKCSRLSEVLAKFPAPRDDNGLAQDIGLWTRQLGEWTTELSNIDIPDANLRGLIEAFKHKWQEVGAALSRLVTILEVGKKYEELNTRFNSEISRANQAIAEANAACQR